MLSRRRTSNGTLPIDVLVIGGGLQGLLALDRLLSDGFSCALVTASNLGSGQTLHSHGVLNAGFGMAGPEPVRLLREVVLPDLARRGVRTYGEWAALVPAPVPGAALLAPPPGVEMRGGALVRLPEVNVGKREMLSALARGREDHILSGTVTGATRAPDGSLRTLDVAAAGDSDVVVFAPAAVVVAAGTGSKALLRRLGAGEAQIEDLKHRRVHVLCVRGPSSVLPVLNLVSPADQLFVAAHEHEGWVTYYATPMLFGAPHVEEVPDDASAEVDEAFVRQGWDTLFRMVPLLESLPGLRFASYAGFRQDIGDWPGLPKCERMEAVPNLIAALPSGLLGAWPVATRTAALVSSVVSEKQPQPAIPAETGASVGDSHEDGSGIEWSVDALLVRRDGRH